MIADWFDVPHTDNPLWVLAADVIVKGTLLFLLAMAAHAILGRRHALIRSALWNAVLLTAILQPAVTLGLPRFRIACLPAPEVPAMVSGTHIPRGFDGPAGRGLADVSIIPEMPVVTPADPLRPSAQQPGESQADLTPALSVLMGISGVGAMIFFLRLIASLDAVARLKRAAVTVEDPSWTGPLARWRDRLQIARPVKVVRSNRVRVPMVLGWRRPAIVLPDAEENAVPWPSSQVDAVLLHELAHLRRGDDVWNLVQQVVQILYWPHPLAWLSGRMIAGVREQACDDLCVRLVGGAQDYRAALVAVASRLVRGSISSIPTSLGLAMARASSSALLRRLCWINQTPGASACLLRWPGRLAIALLVLGSASSISTIELTPGRAAQASRESTPGRAIRADDGAAVRAYDQPVPDSARFQTVALTVLDDETSKPIADAEVMILNDVDLGDRSFPTDANGRLRFEYPYIGSKAHREHRGPQEWLCPAAARLGFR